MCYRRQTGVILVTAGGHGKEPLEAGSPREAWPDLGKSGVVPPGKSFTPRAKRAVARPPSLLGPCEGARLVAESASTALHSCWPFLSSNNGDGAIGTAFPLPSLRGRPDGNSEERVLEALRNSPLHLASSASPPSPRRNPPPGKRRMASGGPSLLPVQMFPTFFQCRRGWPLSREEGSGFVGGMGRRKCKMLVSDCIR